MANWMSFITHGGEPLLINMDQARVIEPAGSKHPNSSVLDGRTVRTSIQTLALMLNAVPLQAELVIPEKPSE